MCANNVHPIIIFLHGFLAFGVLISLANVMLCQADTTDKCHAMSGSF